MHHSAMIDYLSSTMAPSCPRRRGAEVLEPLWTPAASYRASQRERVLRLCSDYRHGAGSRRFGKPVDVGALPVGYRLYAYMLLHRTIFSPTFFDSIKKAIELDTPVSRTKLADTPMVLKRLPELDHGLVARYALEGEKQRLGKWAGWWDTATDSHHQVPHSMGGTDATPNTVKLPKRFHSHLHLVSINLPPHLGLIALMAWSGFDDRAFPRHDRAVGGVYDIFRQIGRDRDADIGNIYRSEAVYDGAAAPSKLSDRDKTKIRGTGLLRYSIRIGARW